jgi:uncharacterized protein
MFRQINSKLAKTLQIIVVGSIRVYRWVISPWLMRCCRFYPSCSQYAIDAVKAHGTLKGIGFTVWRLARCHPGSAGGVDLVPRKKKE